MSMRQTIGRYQIIEHIASGGQATVFRAWDTSTGRVVALKLLHQHLAESGPHLYRFHREARLAAEAAHPNIVQVYEVGRDGDSHFIAMEYLPVSLDDLMRNQRQMPVDRVVDIARQIAGGLEAMRVRGVVHRDIKPPNVLIGADGQAKLADFGISRLTEDARLTRTGAVMGTPHYMSPEQAHGKALDTRSDLYSLGVVMYQMLAGDVPFDADTPFEVIRKHINEQPRPLRQIRPDVAVALQRIVSRCLAKSPDRRYNTPLELDSALAKAFPSSNPAQPRRAETPASAAGHDESAGSPIVETPPLGIPPPLHIPWARRFARHMRGRRGVAVAVVAIMLLALGGGVFAMTSLRPAENADDSRSGGEGGAGLSYQLKAEVVARVQGPASLPLEDRHRETGLFLHRGDTPNLAGMRVTLPDGRTLTSDRVGAETYFFVDLSGLPQPGETYKFVGLDEDRRPLAGTDQTVTWEAFPAPGPPGGVRAQATPRGIEVTWEATPPARFDPRDIYILHAFGPSGKLIFVEATGIYSSLIVVPRSRAEYPLKEWYNYFPIAEWPDGIYRISVETRVFNGPREATTEYWVWDPSQDVTVTVVGGVVKDIKNPGNKPAPMAAEPTATPTPCPNCSAPDLQPGACLDRRSPQDQLKVLDLAPSSGSPLTAGATVTAKADVQYRLDSFERAELKLTWERVTTTPIKVFDIARLEVPRGEGVVSLEGFFVLPEGDHVRTVVHMFPLLTGELAAQYQCANSIRFAPVGTYAVANDSAKLWGPLAGEPAPTPTPCPSCGVPNLQAGLIAYWPANGNADDAAGEHHGALRKGATFGPGKVGQAFDFSQSGAHVEILSGNDDFNYDHTEPMTVGLWVKRTYPPGPWLSGVSLHVLGKRPYCGPNEDVHFQIYYDSNRWGFAVGVVSGVSQITETVDLLLYDQWRHVAVTFDGFAFRLYVDGTLVGGPNFGAFSSPQNAAPLLLGDSGSCGSFIGLMDEVRFYNRALSEAEVKALFVAGA
ncbi:MAG: protein kinase [Chloroflexi bacterium]|nr:protein kinase [Chloroflexota bacterium]